MPGQLDVGTLEALIGAILAAVVDTIDAFIPAGLFVTGSMVIILIVMSGVSIAAGAHFLPSLVRMTGIAASTFYVIEAWPEIVTGMLDATHKATALLIPGYQGPNQLFTMAIDIAGRLELEKLALTWTAIFASVGAVLVGMLVPLLTVIGLSFIGFLALMAEVNLVLGAAAAPLILPALAFPLTAPIGWGCISFLVTASTRVIIMGALSHIFASAITNIIDISGTETWLQNEETFLIALISIMCIIFGIGAYTISGQLVGGAMGAVGLGTTLRSAATLAAGGKIVMAGAPAAGMALNTMARGAGTVSSAINSARGGGSGGIGSGGPNVGTSSGSGTPWAA